jgi:hypothetical protein
MASDIGVTMLSLILIGQHPARNPIGSVHRAATARSCKPARKAALARHPLALRRNDALL